MKDEILKRYYAETTLCGKFDGVCVRPQGHEGGCSNPPQGSDLSPFAIGGFKQVSAERYDEMLGVLPPAIMTGRGFLVGEAWRHNDEGRPMFAAFLQLGTGDSVSFYESLEPMTVTDFKRLCDSIRYAANEPTPTAHKY